MSRLSTVDRLVRELAKIRPEAEAAPLLRARVGELERQNDYLRRRARELNIARAAEAETAIRLERERDELRATLDAVAALVQR